MAEWKQYQYGDIISIKSEKIKPSEYSGTKCIELEHLSQGTGEILGTIEVSNQKSIKNKFEKGQVLFGKLRPYLKKYARPDFTGACSTEIWVMHSINDNLSDDFLYLIVQSKQFIDLANSSTGSKMPRADWSYIEDKFIWIPSIIEQKMIAEILSTWDEAINKLLINIENEKRKKKSIVSKIYRGQVSENNINIEDFKRLKHFLIEVSLRNNGAVDNVLSVSNSKGFVPQDEQFEREVASKDRSNYKVVSKGEFAYNPSRVNVGSIDLLTTHASGILSPMYVVFKCNNDLNNSYLYHFLKSDLFLQMIPKYTQGSVRDSLSFDGLCSMKLYIPILEEQLEYAQALDAIDNYIKKLEQLLELYKIQKKGLMQQLLTGKVRVSVN